MSYKENVMYYIQILKYEHKKSTKGKKIRSNQFTNIIDAENAAFNFRYNHEFKDSKKRSTNIFLV